MHPRGSAKEYWRSKVTYLHGPQASVIVPSFMDEQWLQNFRMSEEMLSFLCSKLHHVMEWQDTTFHQCVALNKRVAIALWKLATSAKYRGIGHLFGVSNTTVCRFVLQLRHCCCLHQGTPTLCGCYWWFPHIDYYNTIALTISSVKGGTP